MVASPIASASCEQPEPIEDLDGGREIHGGARRIVDAGFRFQDAHFDAGPGQAQRRQETHWPRADDDHFRLIGHGFAPRKSGHRNGRR